MRCFRRNINQPLTESESKLMSTRIEEQTGLVIGAKSIRNYSLFAFGDGKEANPSIATLDTLARYVAEAPATDEASRKTHESHYPYWFAYKEQSTSSAGDDPVPRRSTVQPQTRKTLQTVAVFGFLALAVAVVFVTNRRSSPRQSFADDFDDVSAHALRAHGWTVRADDADSWTNRDQRPEHLTLFTLPGDNWTSERKTQGIQNLLTRKVSGTCWMTEIHLTEFFPSRNWEQAGLLIGEDADFRQRFIRVSIAYNDYFGGYDQAPEIILQGVTSKQSSEDTKPEEFAHVVLFTLAPGTDSLVRANLSHAAIRVERNNDTFRFLFAAGSDVFAFREAATLTFDIDARHIGLFAKQGLSENTSYAPASFDSFSFAELKCTGGK